MKKIILILLFSLILFANSDSCNLDVYFGNGVWNNERAAKISRDALKKFMQVNNPIRFSVNDDTYDFKYAHNKDVSIIDDLLETYWQLYETGQITQGYFTNMTATLNTTDGSISTYMQRINNIIATYNLDVSTMIKKYREESLNLKHNVLLVAHSQGNLFGNQMYDLLTAEEKDRFKMVSVATPANNVAGDYSLNAPYTTMAGDYAIVHIPDSLPSNVFGFGHTFVNSYLYGSVSAPNKINSDITNAVNILDKNICKKEYDYYRLISYMCPTRQDQELVVDIYGTHINENPNTLQREEYIASDVRVRAFEDPVQTISSTTGSNGSGSIIIPDATGECLLTDDDYLASVPKHDKNGCSAYTFSDTSDEPCYYDPLISDACYIGGDEYILDFVSSNTYSSMFTCTTYNMSSDIQDLLRTSSKYH